MFFGYMIYVYLCAFVVSLGMCGLAVWSAPRLVRRRADLKAVQALHQHPTPRVGGVGLFAGFVALLVTLPLTTWYLDDYLVFLLSLLPLFGVALLEDLGVHMRPALRLGAIMLSGLIAAIYWDIWLVSVGLPFLDVLLPFAPFGIAVTVMMAAGTTNAFNLIDGLNGLAGFTGLSTAISIAFMAAAFDHSLVFDCMMVLASMILGFLVWNYPFGKIFLGDAGAYLIGHFLVWVSIGLLHDTPDLNPFAILLVFFWPVADTFLAVWRRRATGRRPDQPDRLHFHQLAVRYLEIRHFGRGRRGLLNPLTTAILLPFIVAPQIVGVMFATSTWVPEAATVMFGLFYMGAYVLVIRGSKRGARQQSRLA